MDDFSQTLKARQTILEMLSDRGYVVPPEYNELDLETFRYLYNNKNIDIFCKEHKTSNEQIYVKFINISKIKPNIIREYIVNITEEFLKEGDVQIILVLKTKPNNSILKIIKEKEYKHADILWLSRLQLNITQSIYVPKHMLLSNKETDELIDIYKLNTINQLPVISRDDPVIKYYNFKPGGVCKIVRPSKTSADHTYYRCIK